MSTNFAELEWEMEIDSTEARIKAAADAALAQELSTEQLATVIHEEIQRLTSKAIEIDGT